MEKYIAKVIEEGFRDKGVIEEFKEIGKKKGNNWTKIMIEIPSAQIRNAIRLLQSNLRKNFFFYVWKDDKMIVVFPNRQFWTTTDRSEWNAIKSYARQIGITELDIEIEQ